MDHNIDGLTLTELDKRISRVSKWTLLAAAAACAMSFFFLGKYLAGGEFHPSQWTIEQWANVSVALLVVLVITAAQYFLYKSGNKGWGAVAGICLLVFFGLFTEINNGMEREGATVRSRSTDSEVYKETVKAIGTASESGAEFKAPTALVSQIAAAQQRLARCEINVKAGREKHCEGDKAKLSALKDAQAAAIAGQLQVAQMSQANALNLADKAQAMSFDESQHFEVIKLFKNWFSISAITASFIFSLIVMGTFEYCFHYLAASESALRRARAKLLKQSNTEQPIQNQSSVSQPVSVAPKQSQNSGAITASAETSSVPAKQQQIGSITPLQPASKPLSAPPAFFDGIGFTSKQTPPISVPAQKNSGTEQETVAEKYKRFLTDSELYNKFVLAAKRGQFKGNKSDFTSINTRVWIASRTQLSNGKSAELAREFLDRAGEAGELAKNPAWTEGSRANKWSLKNV